MSIARQRVSALKELENSIKHTFLKSFRDQLTTLKAQVTDKEKQLVRLECEQRSFSYDEDKPEAYQDALDFLLFDVNDQNEQLSEIKQTHHRLNEIDRILNVASPRDLSVQKVGKLSKICCHFLNETHQDHLEEQQRANFLEQFKKEEESYKQFYQTSIQNIRQGFGKMMTKLNALSNNNGYFYKNAAKASKELLTTFNEKLDKLDAGDLTIKQFFIDCTDAANKHRPVLEKHRGFKALQPILGLLAIAATSIAIGFKAGPEAAAAFLSAVSFAFISSKKVSGFFSPKTDTKEILDELLPDNSINLK